MSYLTKQKSHFKQYQDWLLFAGVVIMTIAIFQNTALAKDLASGVKQIDSEIRNVIRLVGPLCLVIAGATFYINRQAGTDRLLSAVIGTVVFASATTIFFLLERAFN